MRHRSKAARAGFTLIEVLVVISIISLLIALLLPALGAARSHTIRVKCASGMRQIGLGDAVYMTENREWMPLFTYGGGGVYPYATGITLGGAPIPNPYMDELWPDKIRWCPSIVTDCSNDLAYAPLYYPLYNAYLSWGYVRPMVDQVARSWMGDRVDDPVNFRYIQPLKRGQAFVPGPPPGPITYYGIAWSPPGTRPFAADYIFTNGFDRNIVPHLPRGLTKRGDWVNPPGGNSLWGDGSVRWSPWPEYDISGFGSYRDVACEYGMQGELWSAELGVLFWTKPGRL